ncbi:MAG TPA: site-specific integrase [Terriglobia bacterium]|nr:site-specific integrase [Terriglobia bacterium]
MSLYKRGGVWWYDFQVRGVRLRESTGLASKAAAAEAEALRKAQLIRSNRSLQRAEPSPSFEEFALVEFAPWSENEHREHPSTHEHYMRSVKVLSRFFAQRSLDTITPGDVERFKIVRCRQRRQFAKDGRSVTPAAVNRDLAVLRLLFNLAIRLNKARSNPVAGVRLLPEHNLQMRVLSPGEEEVYLAAASQSLRDVAILILETGMRPGEVFRLRKEDVDLQLGFLRIPSGKTPFARRTIPLTGRAKDVLARRTLEAKSAWLFPSRHDPQQPIHWLRKAHVAALQKAGSSPPFRLYDLRHTYLTRMAMAGIDLPTLRELAGHASIQMTMRYVHPTPEHKRAAIEKLAAFCASGSANADNLPGGSTLILRGDFAH